MRDDLNERLKEFAVQVIKFCSELPKTNVARVIGNQLLRSGTSPGANYREASRARSNSEFVAKIGIVIQELDETLYWLELLNNAGISSWDRVQPLHSEADELLSIFTSIAKKIKRRIKGKDERQRMKIS